MSALTFTVHATAGGKCIASLHTSIAFAAFLSSLLSLHRINAGRARASTLVLPHGEVCTPVFMPVGTKAAIKAMTSQLLHESEGLNPQIILGNTYHLALQPQTHKLKEMGGLHEFMGWKNNLLTDSGGFQMVSLLELAEITEEGVRFQSPIDGTSMLLTPEESIRCQNEIGADIIMQLDDVVSSISTDQERFAEATARSVRWLDRCIAAHTRKHDQNLFAIIQGGLDVSPGGLRDQCLKEMIARDTPGYAIGGLAGGEDKDSFWRVVAHCAAALPPNKPRYLMGVGYTLDLLVCVCLGVDMFDCVFPTRTARFGVALVWEGSVKLKMHCFAQDRRPISEQCPCQTCRHYSRAYLHSLLKTNSPLAAQLVTIHNVCHMLGFMRDLRNSILAGTDALHTFVNDYLRANFTSDSLPQWVRDALAVAEVPVLL